MVLHTSKVKCQTIDSWKLPNYVKTKKNQTIRKTVSLSSFVAPKTLEKKSIKTSKQTSPKVNVNVWLKPTQNG